jgi:hypothetical protein
MGGVGSGGQNRKPDEVKRRQGTWRADRANASAPIATVVPVPDPPAYLPDADRRAWEELRREVDSIGTYAESNLGSFRMLVRMTVYADRLAADPGTPTKDLIAASKEVRAWRQTFGLTAQSRATVRGLPDSEGHDPTDRYSRWF